MMMSQHQPMDIPTTIFCRLDEVEQSEDFTMDDLCSSVRSSVSDCCHFDNCNNNLDLSRKSSTTTSPYDNNRVVTNQDLRNMKNMVASMRQNPELLNISPVMQRACLTSSSISSQRQRRCTTDGIPPRLIVPDRHDHHNHHVDIAANDNDAVVKNEDLNAMKHMVASCARIHSCYINHPSCNVHV